MFRAFFILTTPALPRRQLQSDDIPYLAQVSHIMLHMTGDDLLKSDLPGAEMPPGSRPRSSRRLFQDRDRFQAKSLYIAEQFSAILVDEVTFGLLGLVVEPGQVRVILGENGSIPEMHGLLLKVSEVAENLFHRPLGRDGPPAESLVIQRAREVHQLVWQRSQVPDESLSLTID